MECGSTVVLVLVLHLDNHLFCANLGDSAAFVFGRQSLTSLSVPHDLVDSSEERGRTTTRQYNAVSVFNGRLGGTLAVTRALGDFGLKAAFHRTHGTLGTLSPTNNVPFDKDHLSNVPEVT